jgi:mannose-1-phosphate guanylyltransferase
MLSHALVLTAGLGTRLQPLTSVRAKPAIPVAGEPLVRRIIRWLAGQGVADLVLNLHHLPHTLTAVVGDGRDLGARVRYSWEQPEVLGSAGGPRHALPMMGAGSFFIVNGDTLTDVDVNALAAAHEGSGALVTLALAPNREPQKYGGVLTSAGGRVTGFAPSGARAEGSHLFVGVQVARADAFLSLPDGEPINSVGGVYDRLLAAKPGCIQGFVCEAALQDIGTPRDYWNTSFECLAGRPPEEAYGRGARLGSGARVTRSILWDDVEIGAGANVEECIVTDRVQIPAGAVYRRAIITRGDQHLHVTPR